MKSNDNNKKINAQEAAQWLSIIMQMANFIKSLFTKKSIKTQVQPPQPPTVIIEKDTIKNLPKN